MDNVIALPSVRRDHSVDIWLSYYRHLNSTNLLYQAIVSQMIVTFLQYCHFRKKLLSNSLLHHLSKICKGKEKLTLLACLSKY